MGSATAQHTTSDSVPAVQDRIPLPQLAAYGAGGIIPIALFNIAGILVGLMGNISLGLSAFWLGVVLIIPRLWDAVVDPVIGHLSDNTRTRWGRRRPFLLIGGILVAVFFVVMWWIPKGEFVRSWFPTEAGYQWFQLGYILVTLTLFFTSVTIFEIPHGALGAELTSDSHQRTRLFSAKSFVGNLFAMSTPWLFVLANMERFKGPGGNEADGMRYVSLMVFALLVPLSFWWFFTLREPGFKKAAQQEKTPFWHDMKRTVRNKNFMRLTLTIFTLAMGFNFVQLLGSYIPIFYVFGGDKAAGAKLLGINGTVWAVTGLLAVFPLAWISPRLGKRNTLIVAILLIAVAQVAKVFCYNPAYPYLIVIPTMLLSCGMLFFFTLGSSMVGDICDEDELHTGYRAEGSYYSVFWWFIKMGSALASLISGALIVLTMFDETQVTKVDKLQGEVRALLTAQSSSDQQSKLDQATKNAGELRAYLQTRAATAGKSAEHYQSLAQTTQQIEVSLARMRATSPSDTLKVELAAVEKATVKLTKQPPYTLLLMRAVEISLPLLACLFSLLCVVGYALTEARSREIKDQLARRHAEPAAL
jgi:GPH family glycoside/pentoside/hexuronide:cation symporter